MQGKYLTALLVHIRNVRAVCLSLTGQTDCDIDRGGHRFPRKRLDKEQEKPISAGCSPLHAGVNKREAKLIDFIEFKKREAQY